MKESLKGARSNVSFLQWLKSAVVFFPFAIIAISLTYTCLRDVVPLWHGANTSGYIVARKVSSEAASVTYCFNSQGKKIFGQSDIESAQYDNLLPGTKVPVRYISRFPFWNILLLPGMSYSLDPGLVIVTIGFDLIFALPLFIVFTYPLFRVFNALRRT